MGKKGESMNGCLDMAKGAHTYAKKEEKEKKKRVVDLIWPMIVLA